MFDGGKLIVDGCHYVKEGIAYTFQFDNTYVELRFS